MYVTALLFLSKLVLISYTIGTHWKYLCTLHNELLHKYIYCYINKGGADGKVVLGKSPFVSFGSCPLLFHLCSDGRGFVSVDRDSGTAPPSRSSKGC